MIIGRIKGTEYYNRFGGFDSSIYDGIVKKWKI